MVGVHGNGEGKRLIVAAAIISGGKLLLAQRKEPPRLAGLWELPGGQAEDGETPQEALARELKEELGVSATVGERIGSAVETADGVLLHAYLAVIYGTPAALEHSAIQWVNADELYAIAAELVPADREWADDLARELKRAL